MISLKDRISNNIVAPEFLTKLPYTAIGQVMDADEKNNTCSIKYVDKLGKIGNKNDVQVSIGTNKDWFPVPGQLVNIKIFPSGEMYINDDNTLNIENLKIKKKLRHDIYASSGDNSTGNMIF